MNDHIGNLCCRIQGDAQQFKFSRFEMNEFVLRIANVDDNAAWGESRAELFDDRFDKGILTAGG